MMISKKARIVEFTLTSDLEAREGASCEASVEAFYDGGYRGHSITVFNPPAWWMPPLPGVAGLKGVARHCESVDRYYLAQIECMSNLEGAV